VEEKGEGWYRNKKRSVCLLFAVCSLQFVL
jgi:hypothetical protein